MRPGVEWELDRGRGVSGFLETIPAHMSLKRKILDTDDRFIPFGGKLILV